jgi:hypothetical protein
MGWAENEFNGSRPAPVDAFPSASLLKREAEGKNGQFKGL